MRWAEAAIVFQGALHSLNPVRRIETQIAEPIRVHEPDLSAAEVAARVGELLEQVGLPGGPVPGLPPPALGRPAAAGDDRDGAGLPAAADRRRRAHDGARRHGAGADPRPDLRPGEGPRRRAADHQPRPVGARRRVRPGGGHVRRPGRRAAARPEQVFDSPAHPYARALSQAFPRVGDAAARYAPAGLAGDPPDPHDLPPGLRVRAAVRARDRRLHRRGAAVAGRSSGRQAACIRAGEREHPR